MAVALLFAFAPYHIWPWGNHFALSAYFMLPVALVVALSIDDVLGSGGVARGSPLVCHGAPYFRASSSFSQPSSRS